MKILYIGEKQTYQLYKKGIVPSHWLYGAVEMERDGHNVIWCQETRSFFNDLKHIICHRPDVLFIPNFNVKSHMLLLILMWLDLVNVPAYAYLHHSPKSSKGLKSLILKYTLNCFNHIFFLSELSMQETIDGGYIDSKKCSVPEWGPDIDFYDRVKTEDGDYYVSTGKENRDFDILIEAFRKSGAPLKIMTARSHAGNDYSDLTEKCKDIPNIEVVLTENTGNVYPQMLETMAKAKAIVCPLRQDRLDYCVGLSTIADAEGLHKPLIITRNAYHSLNRTKNYAIVESVEDWIFAINHFGEYDKIQYDCKWSMHSAYLRMTHFMELGY